MGIEAQVPKGRTTMSRYPFSPIPGRANDAPYNYFTRQLYSEERTSETLTSWVPPPSSMTINSPSFPYLSSRNGAICPCPLLAKTSSSSKPCERMRVRRGSKPDSRRWVIASPTHVDQFQVNEEKKTAVLDGHWATRRLLSSAAPLPQMYLPSLNPLNAGWVQRSAVDAGAGTTS